MASLEYRLRFGVCDCDLSYRKEKSNKLFQRRVVRHPSSLQTIPPPLIRPDIFHPGPAHAKKIHPYGLSPSRAIWVVLDNERSLIFWEKIISEFSIALLSHTQHALSTPSLIPLS
jgi:hypothetical protein